MIAEFFQRPPCDLDVIPAGGIAVFAQFVPAVVGAFRYCSRIRFEHAIHHGTIIGDLIKRARRVPGDAF